MRECAAFNRLLGSSGTLVEKVIFEAQMIYFLHKGYRVIAHDRRSNGRSAHHRSWWYQLGLRPQSVDRNRDLARYLPTCPRVRVSTGATQRLGCRLDFRA